MNEPTTYGSAATSPPSPGSEIALPSEQTTERPTVAKMLQVLKPEIARALPKGMDAERITRIALTVVRQTPRLAECNPESFAGALLTSAALGLEPGVMGEAYLVPYNNKVEDPQTGRWGKRLDCQLIIGYQGFIKLFYQHPLADTIGAEAVYEYDEFDYGYGTEPYLSHKPARGERGEIIYYYAIASLTNGATKFAVFTPDEIKALRRGKVGSSGDIPDPQHWMERKTALRQLTKLLPRSVSLAMAAQVDEASGRELQPKVIVEQLEAGQP